MLVSFPSPISGEVPQTKLLLNLKLCVREKELSFIDFPPLRSGVAPVWRGVGAGSTSILILIASDFLWMGCK